MAGCEDTIGHVINYMLADFPTTIETVNCTEIQCEQYSRKKYKYWSYQTNTYNNVGDLQKFVNTRMVQRKKNKCGNGCTGIKSITTNISQSFIF